MISIVKAAYITDVGYLNKAFLLKPVRPISRLNHSGDVDGTSALSTDYRVMLGKTYSRMKPHCHDVLIGIPQETLMFHENNYASFNSG